jgi:hypothetical protein
MVDIQYMQSCEIVEMFVLRMVCEREYECKCASEGEWSGKKRGKCNQNNRLQGIIFVAQHKR